MIKAHLSTHPTLCWWLWSTKLRRKVNANDIFNTVNMWRIYFAYVKTPWITEYILHIIATFLPRHNLVVLPNCRVYGVCYFAKWNKSSQAKEFILKIITYTCTEIPCHKAVARHSVEEVPCTDNAKGRLPLLRLGRL